LDLPASLKANTTYAVVGQVSPKIADIKLTVKQGGKLIGEFLTDANGLFTFNTKVSEPGLANYQVVIAAGSKNAAGISDEITVLVR
jgi:hypothetical protein